MKNYYIRIAAPINDLNPFLYCEGYSLFCYPGYSPEKLFYKNNWDRQLSWIEFGNRPLFPLNTLEEIGLVEMLYPELRGLKNTCDIFKERLESFDKEVDF